MGAGKSEGLTFGITADAVAFDPADDRWTFGWWHVDFPDWDVTFTAARTSRGPEIVALTVSAKDGTDPAGGLQARLLRAISLEGVLGLLAGLTTLLVPDADDPAVNAWSAARRPGRAGRQDYDYAVWAARYVEALSSSRPVADLAAQWHLSDSQVRNIIHECRRRDLLTNSAPGRAGGELTEKAKRELRKGGEN